ncbi:hypothetical protein B296_00050283, partial [Ensete ventricosum]
HCTTAVCFRFTGPTVPHRYRIVFFQADPWTLLLVLLLQALIPARKRIPSPSSIISACERGEYDCVVHTDGIGGVG